MNLAPLLGAAIALMMESPFHQHMFLADMKWLLIPPLQLQQFIFFRKHETPIAFASWALLDSETEARVSKGQMRLKPEEWNKGDRLWIIGIVASLGAHDDIIKKVKEERFPDQSLNFLQLSNGGKGVTARSL